MRRTRSRSRKANLAVVSVVFFLKMNDFAYLVVEQRKMVVETWQLHQTYRVLTLL